MKRLLLAAMTALLLSVGAAGAGPYEDANAAYGRGDYATALQIYQPLATQGDARAQYDLGVMYRDGKGVAQDYAEALKWYKLAAAQGYARAQTNIATMYYTGRGVAQDYAEALKWFRLAAAQGDAVGQFGLGSMYHEGQGVAPDYAEATKWLRLAAAQGNAGAQYILGMMYEQGQGVAQDYAEAVKWYRLAAAQGNAGAQSHLDALNAMAPSSAQATTWYAVTVDGNACEDMNGMARDLVMAGGPPANSPQSLMDALRYSGAVPAVSIHRLPNGEKIVMISVMVGQYNLGKVFFSNLSRCQAAVARMIESGDVPKPGELR